MTTYLLHGGATSKDLPGNDEFFAQFTKLVEKNEVKILLCYWSRNRDEWQKLIERDSAKIQKNTEKQVTFHVVEDESELFSKIDEYDVLYVAGGDAELLEPHYESLSEQKRSLMSKSMLAAPWGHF